ncbi:hypothetical protein TNIN_122041 [Trichonephila inaurata madagascariensis]|uniref:Uncharacterized protein n=1 Tax=Trichonephila inaurata madagascariensis TaxID=2747483 RepID=A0A8X7BNR8_9ARAC|nr:hypothetical protein TNIN_122041 [Trichonephila inaurata madagascariensis]
MAANSSFSDRSPQQLARGHSCGTVKQFGTLDTIPASQKEEGRNPQESELFPSVGFTHSSGHSAASEELGVGD